MTVHHCRAVETCARRLGRNLSESETVGGLDDSKADEDSRLGEWRHRGERQRRSDGDSGSVGVKKTDEQYGVKERN